MPLLTSGDLRRHSRLAWASLAALLGCLGVILPSRERMRVLPPRIRTLPSHLDAAPVLATLLNCPR